MLKICRKLDQAGDWLALRDFTDDQAAVIGHPRALLFRLNAAVELRDQGLFDDIARTTLQLDGAENVKLLIVKKLSDVGQVELALKILQADIQMREHPRYLKVISKAQKNLKDGDLKRQFREQADEASGGGSAIKAEASGFTFKPRRSDAPDFGTVQLSAASSVAKHHLPALEIQASVFREGLAKATVRETFPTLNEFRDVFTDRNGQIWNESGQIIRSKGRPIADVNRSSVQQLPIAMMSQSATRGIYHWIVDRLPRFAWLQEPANQADKVPILISDVAPQFEMTSLEMMGLAERAHLVGDAVFVERLIVPVVGFRNLVGWDHVDWAMNTMVSVSLQRAKEAGVQLDERLYISRRDAKRRTLLNEEAVEAGFKDRGFAVYEFSKIPLWQQIALVYSAKVVAGPHGAGLSHLIFAKSGAKIIEIIPIKDGVYQLRFNYARLSIIKNLDYNGWLETQNLGVNDWSLDVAQFFDFVDAALGK